MITITIPLWVLVVAIVFGCIQIALNCVKCHFLIKAARAKAISKR
jgi:hypothetical protein